MLRVFVSGKHFRHEICIFRHEESISEDRKSMETMTVLEAVQSLYGQSLKVEGREAVVDVLTLGNNMDIIMHLTKHSSMEGGGLKDMKKSAVRGYANELLLLCVRTSEDIGFLRKYAKEFVAQISLSLLCVLVNDLLWRVIDEEVKSNNYIAVDRLFPRIVPFSWFSAH